MYGFPGFVCVCVCDLYSSLQKYSDPLSISMFVRSQPQSSSSFSGILSDKPTLSSK